MLKRLAFLFMLTCLFVLPLLVQAQDDIVLSDEPVLGELTNDDYAIFYTYKGKKDEVIVINMVPVEVLGDLNTPSIIIRDPKGRDLVRTDGFGSVVVVTLLPVDGEYTIIATRSDDASGDSVGEFNIWVMTATELEIGDAVEAKVDSDNADYYVYRGEDDFSVSFTRTGEYAPELSINKMNEQYSPGSLDSLVSVAGDLAVDVTLGSLPGGELYVIKLDEALFDFNFETAQAGYMLSIGESKAE